MSDAASAREVLARVALAENNREEANRHLQAAHAGAGDPFLLRRRVRDRLLALSKRLAPIAEPPPA
jgi:hypothetical protein